MKGGAHALLGAALVVVIDDRVARAKSAALAAYSPDDESDAWLLAEDVQSSEKYRSDDCWNRAVPIASFLIDPFCPLKLLLDSLIGCGYWERRLEASNAAHEQWERP